jgi:NAD(P)-dependent dehydrogenase (short-subunit alcohol dehydrogenase family)
MNTAPVLVTGAGSGIGRAIASKLSAQFPVALVGRQLAPLEETAHAITLEGGKAFALQADIRKASSLTEGLQKQGIQTLHGFIANAGVGGENHYGEGDRWAEIIDINLTGTYTSVSACMPLLLNDRREGDYRHIVLVASILARLGVPGYTAYCASKSGLLGLMRSWAAQYAGERLLVNAICPGWVNTEMAHQGLQTFAETTGQSFEEIHEREMSYVPLGKMSEPAEIAAMVDLLVGGAQTSITGQTLDMNNGALMP